VPKVECVRVRRVGADDKSTGAEAGKKRCREHEPIVAGMDNLGSFLGGHKFRPVWVEKGHYKALLGQLYNFGLPPGMDNLANHMDNPAYCQGCGKDL
jgi:hypothetical protein